MTKKPKRNRLLITVFLAILLSSIAYAAVTPNVHAAEATTQEKGLTILNDVANLDMAKYATNAKECAPYAYLGVVPQENVAYDLTSTQSKLKVFLTFAQGKLQLMQVLESEGSPQMTIKATGIFSNSVLEKAKTFLGNYQAYTGDSLYGALETTLQGVSLRKNVTLTSGNVQLETITSNGDVAFKWTYTLNGALASSKFVGLGFKNGSLQYFVDNWGLYRIGSTSVKVSEEEAKALALQTAKNHQWNGKVAADAFDAKNFNGSNVVWTSLVFDGSLDADNARSDDPLLLYPVWRVGVGLDKWYGQLYGIEVDVWADTGKVRLAQEAYSTLPPPEGAALANTSPLTGSYRQMIGSSAVGWTGFVGAVLWVAPWAFATGAVGAGVVWLSRKKRVPQYKLPKPIFKTGGIILLCILVSSMMLFVPVPVAKADVEQAGAVIWGSESLAAGPPYLNWRKSEEEIYWQQWASSCIAYYLGQNGYAAYNNQGYPGSVKGNLLGTLSSLQDDYARVAVVDFDHGVGRHDYSQAPGEFHYMIEDEWGTGYGSYNGNHSWDPEYGVYDRDIYPLTTSNKIFFAFISTCMSARIVDTPVEQGYPATQGMATYGARGMPFAWTHRYVKSIYTQGFDIINDMSDDGYDLPDGGLQCYIGFPYGSPSLSQDIPFNTSSPCYRYWVYNFFYFASSCDWTINAALDYASSIIYGTDFLCSNLRNGFTAYWPGLSPGYNSTMAVYGNGNIGLKPHSLTVNANDGQNPVNADVYIDGEYRGTTGNTFVTTSGYHTVQVESSTHTFHYFSGYSDLQNPITVSVTSDITVTANYYSNPPPQYLLSISAGQGGTTASPWAPGDYLLTPQLVTVTAVPSSGLFDHWLLDWNTHYENPIGVPMSGNHTLQAVFRNTAWVTVLAMEDCYWLIGLSGIPIYIDGDYAGTTSAYFSLPMGTHTIGMENQWSDGYGFYFDFLYWCDQYGNPLEYDNPLSASITSDTTLIALYHVHA